MSKKDPLKAKNQTEIASERVTAEAKDGSFDYDNPTCDVCLGKKTVLHEGDDWVCPECAGTGTEDSAWRKRVSAEVPPERFWSDEVCAIAHELGVEYVPDMGPTWPGEIGALLGAIRELKERSNRLHDIEDRPNEGPYNRPARCWACSQCSRRIWDDASSARVRPWACPYGCGSTSELRPLPIDDRREKTNDTPIGRASAKAKDGGT